jgi:hypothetical protein
MGVLATDLTSSIESQITIDDLIKMTDKELTEVPQDTIRSVLDSLFNEGEKAINRYSEKDLLRITEQSVSNQIENAINSISDIPPTTNRDTGLEIGWSVTVDWAEDGGGGTSGWGTKSYDYDINENESESLVGCVLYGDPTAWAWRSHDFVVTGTGYGLYRIDIGDISWKCSALMGTCKLKLVVEEWSNGEFVVINQYDMDEYSSPFGYSYYKYFDYSISSAIPLYAGTTYRISIWAFTTANTIAGAAGADIMSDYFGSWWDTMHLEYIS